MLIQSSLDPPTLANEILLYLGIVSQIPINGHEGSQVRVIDLDMMTFDLTLPLCPQCVSGLPGCSTVFT